MRKYPYTDSTEMIKYEPKIKKPSRLKPFIPCIVSAVLASVITAGAVGIGGYAYLNANNQTVTTSGLAGIPSGAPTLVTTNGGGELTVNEIAKRLGPSCVGVINKAKVQPQRFYDPFSGRYYYYQNPAEGEMVQQGSGSGIIISQDGYIVTNQHVIEGASEISVILNTGEEFSAKLIGQDAKTDLAVLKINPGDTKITAAT